MAGKPTRKTLASRAARMLKLKAKGAALYSEANKIGDELSRHLKHGDELKLADGVVVKMIDPFIGKDGDPCKAWRHVPVERYEFKVATPTQTVSD